MFELKSDYKPTGDQPKAIKALVDNINKAEKHQVLLGVTGSGKTYTVANVIEQTQKPTLFICHNKTLAAQNYQELREFFPNNAVEYFVSYYDYFQPESYIPQTDTYIEKDADINDKIDKLRLAATTSLMTRKDVIVVASVSCIYNIGSPAEYSQMAIELRKGMKLRKVDLFTRLAQIYYERSEFEFRRGTYRVRGDTVDIYPAYLDYAVRIEIFDDKLAEISHFDPLTGGLIDRSNLPEVRRGSSTRAITQDSQDFVEHRMTGSDFAMVFPAKHYVAAEDRRKSALEQIKVDLDLRLKQLRDAGKSIEAYRLEQKTNYDMEMMTEVGYCKGIENYSRYFDGRNPGDPPYTLMDFFPKDYLLVIDESHITVPQIRGMYNGDRARKQTLIEYGFRLPSALDNRPLNFEEFSRKLNQTLYISATPAEWELTLAKKNIIELLIRPTGIVDPEVIVLPTEGQIQDLLGRIRARIAEQQRVLVTTLTKRMAEELSSYLLEQGIKVTYLHSDIVTLERSTILDDLRRGNYDVLVGINLLREGLDLPEVSLVVILDADKEGFLRSESSLVQTMGRAARHISGQVVMYADKVTDSMKRAISEVERRRQIQLNYNDKYHINPTKIVKPIRGKLIDDSLEEELNRNTQRKPKIKEKDYMDMPPVELKREISKLAKEMKYEAEMLNFERAADLRDTIQKLRKLL